MTAYAFVVTAILAKVFDLIPFLRLRVSEQGEIVGMDEDQVWIDLVASLTSLISYSVWLFNSCRSANSVRTLLLSKYSA